MTPMEIATKLHELNNSYPSNNLLSFIGRGTVFVASEEAANKWKHELAILGCRNIEIDFDGDYSIDFKYPKGTASKRLEDAIFKLFNK